MKKWVLITGIIILIIAGVLVVHRVKNNMPKVLPNGTVVYNFTKQSQPKASKILYEYIFLYYKKYAPYIISKYKISKNNILAFEYDLNDDGEKEIIGYINSDEYRSRNGYNLYILKRIDKESYYNEPYAFKIKNSYYNEISTVLGLEKDSKIYILPIKTKSFKNIILEKCVSFPTVIINCEIDFKNSYYSFK